MKPLSEFSPLQAKRLAGVLFDLDDTVLDHGALGEPAYRALFELHRAGLRLVAVTGRPAGWGDVLVRMWPIDAAVTENGAVAIVRRAGRIQRLEAVEAAGRRARRIRLASAYESLKAEFAEARLADDVDARTSDLTVDIGETEKVPPERVALMVAFARRLGIRTFTSSVHLHLTLDTDDKGSGAVSLLVRHFGEDPTRARFRYAYVGDSENDAAAFATFETTFGVANVRGRLGRISLPPRFVASQERGAGFAEIAATILQLRNG